jgi:saccharopine dehydrogenase-like NADP-dependent oxidoreductase
MKTIIFGIGRQGKRVLELLIEKGFNNISVFDIRNDILKELIEAYSDIVKPIEKNPFNLSDNDFSEFLTQYDIIVDALPSLFSYKLLKASSTTGKKIVSVSYLEEDFMKLDEIARKHKTIIIPDCGAAPGMSHLLAGYSTIKIKDAYKVIMKVGAIPEKPVSPFMHNITWSPYDLIQEYIRKAKIKKDGKIILSDPFDNIKDENIFNLSLESFYTDGVRSFIISYPNIKDVEERTFRYKGHLDFMKSIKSLGFLSKEGILLNKNKIKLDNLLSKLFEINFGKLPIEDIYIMEIIVKGVGKTHKHKYIIRYDYKNRVSALVNSVAITAVTAVQLLSKEKIIEKGVLPLEKIASDNIYHSFVNAHKEIGALYDFIEEN